MKKPLKTLFFIGKSTPTDAEVDAADALSGTVVFRNAKFVPAAGCLEQCDLVAGSCIPERYAEAYETAGEKKTPTTRKKRVAKKDVVKEEPAAEWKHNA